jgi:hypothetical protein
MSEANKIKSQSQPSMNSENPIKEQINSTSGDNPKEASPINFQLISKMDILSMEKFIKAKEDSKEGAEQITDKSLNEKQIKRIITIKEISKNYIGILFDNNSLSIYNTNTFSKVNEIKINVPQVKEEENDDGYYRRSRIPKEIAYNFIVLKNSDLVLWTLKRIFFYKASEKDFEYKLYQTVDESKVEPKNDPNDFFSYNSYRKYYNKDECTINSVYELNNGNLIICSTNCIEIYTKKADSDNYTLLSTADTEIEVKGAIEIKPNKVILIQKDYESGGFCSQTYYCIHTYSVSLYNIENNSITTLNKFKESQVSLKYNDITFFNNDKYLFIKYGGFKFDIFDINQNFQSINSNNEIIKSENIREFYNFFRERNYKKINKEMDIRFLCNYSKDLFFAKDANEEIKLYKFKDQSFEFYQKFPFSPEEIIGMIELKNNKIIMFSRSNAFVISAS